MSTIQNLKNFIRHGKQARDGRSPQDQATTHVSPVHAQQHRGYQNYNSGPQAPQPVHHGISEPNVYEHKPLQANAPQNDYSARDVDNRGQAAKAGHAAANAVDQREKRKQKEQDYDPSVLERIVAEERESKGKLPRYPGLERWQLIEKMGDGAFSNVYRAKDTQGRWNEVAIKVVRKFEMNSQQVSIAWRGQSLFPTSCRAPASFPLTLTNPTPTLLVKTQHTNTVPIRAVSSIPTTKRKRRKQSRCALQSLFALYLSLRCSFVAIQIANSSFLS